MKAIRYLLCGVVISGGLFSTVAGASSWQDTVSSAASQLSSATSTNTSSAGSSSSLSSLTSLLSGGDQALSAGNMSNAAGILQYCVKQKLTNATDATSVQNQLMSKLGLSAPQQKTDTHYQDGIKGLLDAQSGQPLDLHSIGNSSLAQEVKTKACDLVLKQGMSFLS